MARSYISRITTLRLPFSATSAADKIDMVAAGIPVNADGKIMEDMWFSFINETTYDVRLEGFPEGKPFQAITRERGWSILARIDKPPLLSRKPLFCSLQAFSTQGNPFDPATADFTDCYLELVYGRIY